ncbi:unnamed protein product [Ectocarpus fasciculatus]
MRPDKIGKRTRNWTSIACIEAMGANRDPTIGALIYFADARKREGSVLSCLCGCRQQPRRVPRRNTNKVGKRAQGLPRTQPS